MQSRIVGEFVPDPLQLPFLTRMYCVPIRSHRIDSTAGATRGVFNLVRSRNRLAAMTEMHTSTSWTGKTLPVFEETGCIYLDYNATTPIYPEVWLIRLAGNGAFGIYSNLHDVVCTYKRLL